MRPHHERKEKAIWRGDTTDQPATTIMYVQHIYIVHAYITAIICTSYIIHSKLHGVKSSWTVNFSRFPRRSWENGITTISSRSASAAIWTVCIASFCRVEPVSRYLYIRLLRWHGVMTTYYILRKVRGVPTLVFTRKSMWPPPPCAGQLGGL